MSNFFKSGKAYRVFTTLTLACIMLVILAGSLVKVTDSGMGCPDWPKCFGHYIPPFSEDEVVFKPKQKYFENQMIIEGNNLWKAKENFTSTLIFDPKNWEQYDKHNYSKYNPVHTFIEYINRLTTVVLGIIALLMFYSSFYLWKTNKVHVLLSFLVLALIVFEAWLGRLVVDSELSPLKVSVHLYAAFLLVIIMCGSLVISTDKKVLPNDAPKYVLLICWLILLVQLFLGTQLREIFDEFYNKLKLPREHWIEQAGIKFLVHRSFSIAYLIGVIYFTRILLNIKSSIQNRFLYIYFIPVICVLEIMSGMIMAYFDVPRLMQPLHVFTGSLLLLAHSNALFSSFKTL